MTEYTPTTDEVRRGYVTGLRQAFVGGTAEHEAEFDRWLAQVKADAWDEGFEGGYFHGAYLKPRPTNPYREARDGDS